MIVNSSSLPIKPSGVEIYDTSAEYSSVRVSYGISHRGDNSEWPLLDGASLEFKTYMRSAIKQICEMNLIKCLYLNLNRSSITSLNT